MKRFFHQLNAFLEALYHTRHRRELARIERNHDDVFMLLVHAETLGIDNPAASLMLELKPLLADDFHAWHRRMGIRHSPLDCARCC